MRLGRLDQWTCGVWMRVLVGLGFSAWKTSSPNYLHDLTSENLLKPIRRTRHQPMFRAQRPRPRRHNMRTNQHIRQRYLFIQPVVDKRVKATYSVYIKLVYSTSPSFTPFANAGYANLNNPLLIPSPVHHPSSTAPIICPTSKTPYPHQSQFSPHPSPHTKICRRHNPLENYMGMAGRMVMRCGRIGVRNGM
jgi:hypothetical protein